MQLSFQTVNVSPVHDGAMPLESLLRAAASAGFTWAGIDVYGVREMPEPPGERPERVAALLDELGLTCPDMLALRVSEEAGYTVATAHEFAALARATGATAVGVAISCPPDQAPALLEERASILSAAGVRMALEFLPYFWPNSMDDAIRVCGEIGWDRMGLMVDSWHVGWLRTPLEDIAALDPEQIVVVQLADAQPRRSDDVIDESRNRRVLPGTGTLDLHAFMEAVRATGYEGVVHPEVLSAELRASDPDSVARELFAALQPYVP